MLKEQIEGKTNVKQKCDDVIIQWMIRWAAMMVSRCTVGKDYERRRGRACRAPVATFGEKVWYKQIREQEVRKDKIESEWHEGLWVGQSISINETIVGTSEGAFRAYATRRQDADERWKRSFRDPQRGQTRIGGQVGEPDPKMQPWKEPQMRRMKITESMLQKYGRVLGGLRGLPGQSCRHDSEVPRRSLSETKRAST